MSEGKRHWLALLGVTDNLTGHTEKWVSAVGGFAGIATILAVSLHTLSLTTATALVASMGASAVLLFAVPHSPLAQPWAVTGGHLVSAVIGVSCLKLGGDGLIPAAMAVAGAILAMHYLRCIHPPGGATALSAVVGGDAVAELGYEFVITPVLENVAIILVVALVFNYPFRWRRYPSRLAPEPEALQTRSSEARDNLSHSEITAALRSLDTTVDISERDLEMIYQLARRNASSSQVELDSLQVGACYSNGECGDGWQIRCIIDLPDQEAVAGRSSELVIYKVVAGDRLYDTGTATRREFVRWAAWPVEKTDEHWQRIESLQA